MNTTPGKCKPIRGRPVSTTTGVRVNIILTLFPGEDDDLLGWFEAMPQGQRARRVKGALRQGGVSLPREVEDDAEEIIDDDAFAAMLGAL